MRGSAAAGWPPPYNPKAASKSAAPRTRANQPEARPPALRLRSSMEKKMPSRWLLPIAAVRTLSTALLIDENHTICRRAMRLGRRARREVDRRPFRPRPQPLRCLHRRGRRSHIESHPCPPSRPPRPPSIRSASTPDRSSADRAKRLRKALIKNMESTEWTPKDLQRALAPAGPNAHRLVKLGQEERLALDR